MLNYERIGLRLKKLRIYLGLTQEQVANILCVGRDAILRIEKGKRKIDIEELNKFSKLYCVTIDELINDENKTYNEIAFARGYSELNETDKLEIIKLIEYKNIVKKNDKEFFFE